jgi:hypothetical protein
MRFRRAWVWCWCLGYLPAMCGGNALFGGRVLPLAIGWLVAWVGLMLSHSLSRCPRCGRLFNMSWMMSNPFTSRCLNCGLQLCAVCAPDGGARAANAGGGSRPRAVGSVGASYDNAFAESVIGLYKTKVVRRRGPWRHLEDVESRLWSGSTGSTTGASSPRFSTCHQLSTRSATTTRRRPQP